MLIFELRRADGKVANQCLSEEHAERERQWLIASGEAGPFTITTIRRAPLTRWGYTSAPHRYCGPWPVAKIEEFRTRYAAGESVNSLCEQFQTSAPIICRLARRLGFIRRPDDPARFEKHCGRWTEREKQLINVMYDQGICFTKIPDHHPRTKSAVKECLRNTARIYSTRSKSGRFIKPGRRTIHRVLEEA